MEFHGELIARSSNPLVDRLKREALGKHVRENATHLFDDEDHLMEINTASHYNRTLY